MGYPPKWLKRMRKRHKREIVAKIEQMKLGFQHDQLMRELERSRQEPVFKFTA
jgi:hypothetical protein